MPTFMTAANLVQEPPAATATVRGVDFRIRLITTLEQLEEQCDEGLLGGWNDLIAADRFAHLNQSPAWCLPWYRAYRDRFEPLVVSVWRASVLCGLAPLAVERRRGRLTFAGDNLADYRDVLASPDALDALLSEVIAQYRRTPRTAPLRIGPTQPGSPTVEAVTALCGRTGAGWTKLATEQCCRLEFSPEELQKIAKKKWIRYSLNQYKKEGPVRLEVVSSPARWSEIRDLLYDHHSLRQLHANRPVSFNDPAKRAFYDALVAADHSPMHVALLHAGNQIVAEHCGYIWRGNLTMGVPGFNALEERRSPGLVLLSLLFQDAAAAGLTGVDFTAGADSYKLRFSNTTVDLPVAEVYCRRTPFVLQAVQGSCRSVLRALRRRIPESARAWAERLRVRRGDKSADRSDVPVAAEPSGVGRRGTHVVYAYQLSAVGSHMPESPTAAAVHVHRNELRPLLRGNVAESRLRKLIRHLVEGARAGDTVYTLTRRGELLGWARSRLANGPLVAREDGRAVESKSETVVILGFRILTTEPEVFSMALGALFGELSGTSNRDVLFLTTDAISPEQRSGPAVRLVSV